MDFCDKDEANLSVHNSMSLITFLVKCFGMKFCFIILACYAKIFRTQRFAHYKCRCLSLAKFFF